MILFTKQHAFSVSDSSCQGTTTVKGIGLVLDMEDREKGWGDTVTSACIRLFTTAKLAKKQCPDNT